MNLKKILQHNKNRDKEMARIAEKTNEAVEARKNGTLKIDVTHTYVSSTFKDLEQEAMKQASITREITQANVRQACAAMLGLIPRQGTRQLILQVRSNLPGEIRKVLQGRTAQEAFDFYWSIPEFQEVWPKLGFTEKHLHDYVDAQVKALGRSE
jgi:hypothetical protein